MKFSKKRQQFEASNVTFNASEISAYSYGWWKFVALVNGKVVFNNHFYSSSTSKHQSKVRRLMHEKGIKIDFVVDTRSSLSSSVWQSLNAEEIDGKIEKLEKEMQVKGSHKAKNEKRAATIEHLKAHKEEMLKIGLTKLESLMAI